MKDLFRIHLLSCFFLSLFFVSCQESLDSKKTWETASSAGYDYKYVKNDPAQARFYTLDNGLTVILSPSVKEPRIQTFFAVKAGSKTDPANHTGLAHYLEHMLFKGTDQFGSLDWDKEEPLLDKIEGLYEQYNSTTDEEERKAIYKKIDEVSGEAAKYAIANEYDKMMSGMGAQGTNAFTSVEETVYTEDIPSNVIDKYLTVQAERFRNPAFRLFHTELEAVYEEKNRSLDSDGSKVFEEMFKQLFQKNNYGKQTTIGTIEHLKNPSLKEIRKYFNTYYVPNNMGIIMAGDFDPDAVISKIDEAFGSMESKEIPEYTFDAEDEIESPIVSEVYGPEPESIMLGYRFPGASSEDAQMLALVGELLTNGSAGLIDLNLVKKQKLLSAYAFPYVLKDYSSLLLRGAPTGDQDLDEVKDLLLGQIEQLKAGAFSDDLIASIINNEKKDALKANENYTARAYALMDNFTVDGDWLRQVNYVDWLSKVKKQDIVDFANQYFKDNYVAVYKRQGEDKETVKVEKPQITPVTVNRDDQSAFLQKVDAMPENEIAPLWLDYDRDLEKSKAGNYDVLTVQNKDNGLFSMDYRFETGSWSNKLLPIAVEYLDYIGTEEKTSEDISKAFYQLASSFSGSVSGEEFSLHLTGLQENFEETVALFDDLLKNAVADEEALASYINRLKKARANAKDSKSQIMNGLRSYAMYGKENPFNNNFSDEELDAVKAEDVVALLHEMRDYPHQILYHGPKSGADIAKLIENVHPTPDQFIDLPEKVTYERKETVANDVLMAYYDMVQAEVFWIRNGSKYNPDLEPDIALFNQYFGGGMESIVFQTIRESKALAYSTFANYGIPSKADQRDILMAYIGAQSDKFGDAVDGMNALLTDLPESKKNVENAKTALRKKMATDRITGRAILYNYLAAQKMGRDYDVRKVIYNRIPDMDFEDLKEFFAAEVEGKDYAYCIVAGKGNLDQSKLAGLGEVKVLDLKEIFGY